MEKERNEAVTQVERKRDEDISTMSMCRIFAESGMFPDVQTAAQGYVKVIAGREIGLSPMQSLNAFYFVDGRLGIMAQAAAGLLKQSGKYDYHIQTLSDTECEIVFSRKGEDGTNENIGVSRFDFKMAAKAGLVNKDNWKSYPKNMLFARALMNGIRWYCPDAIGSTFYAVEELKDISISQKKTVSLTNGQVTIGTKEVQNG